VVVGRDGKVTHRFDRFVKAEDLLAALRDAS
jgi:hypothetical protein